MVASPNPSSLSVAKHLIKTGVSGRAAKQAAFAAQLALDRYKSKVSAPLSDKSETIKIQADEIARAAAKLVEAVHGASDACWAQLEFAHDNPLAEAGSLPTEAGYVTKDGDDASPLKLVPAWRERVGPRANFEADVRRVRDAARGALKKLKQSGRPAGAKAALVDELAMIWWRATDKPPTTSGAGDFEAPSSQFGEFVKCVVGSDPDFIRGFGELLTAAGRRIRQKKVVSEPLKKS